LARSYAPRDKEAQKVADAEQAPDAAAERAEALQSLKGNADAIEAMAHAAEMAGPAATAPTLLEYATDYLRELEGVGEEAGGQGEEGGGYAQEEGGGGGPPADEEPPADPDDVAERIEEMVEEGPPPDSDEPGGPPAMRDAAGGGPPDPDAVRPLLEGSTAQPLPEAAASRLGSVLDHDLSHVMIHIDGKAAEAADALHANAFALGTHVFFGGGRYQPGTPGGDMLLLHELTHVMQYDHKQLRESTTGAMEVSSPGESAEAEARTTAFHGLNALRAADRDGDEARVVGDQVHPIGRGMRPENQPMQQFPREALPDKGVIFREEDLEAGDDEGWVIAKIRDYSPELAEVLTEGFEATMGTDLLTAASVWVGSLAPELDLEGLLVEVTTSLTEGASLLLGAVQGDMLCCERITEIAEALSTSLDQLLGSGGFMESLEDQMTWASKFLGGLGATLVDGALDAVATLADTIGLTWFFDKLDELVAWLGAGAATLVDKALVALGLPTLAELPDLLAEQAAEVLATAYEGLQSLVDEVAIYLADFDAVAMLAEVGAHLTEAAGAVSWLAEHWGEPDLWEAHGEEVAAQFSRFGAAMELTIRGWAGVQGWMASGAELWGQVQTAAKGMVTHPVFGWVFVIPGFSLLLSPIILVAAAGDPLWGELASALGSVGSWVMWATEILMEVGTVLSGMVNPMTALPMIAGLVLGSLTLLPECYQAPVLDALILMGSVASGVLTAPLLALGPIPAMVYQANVSFWDTLADKSVEEKATLLAAIAAMLRMSFVPDLLAGLVVGVVKGLWDEVVGLITLIVGGLALLVGSAGAALSVLPLLAKAISDYAEGAKERQEAEGPGEEESVDDIAEELDPGFAPVEESDFHPGDVDTAPPSSYDGLREALGAAWEAMEDGADWVGAKLADGMVAIIEGAESGAYTLGEWVGWGAVMYFAGGIIGKGAKMLADAFPWLARILTELGKVSDAVDGALDKVLGPLRNLTGLAGDAFDAVLDGLKAIPLPFVRPIVAGIDRAKERMLHWLGVLLAKLTKKVSKKKKKPEADKPEGDPKKAPDEDGKKKRDDDEDDTDEARIARKAASRAFDAVYGVAKKDLLTKAEVDGKLRAEPDRIEGTKVSVALKVETTGTPSWTVEGTAGTGTAKRTRAARSTGWVAEPAKGMGGERMYGGLSAEADNLKKGEGLVDDYEKAWQSLFDTLDGDEADELESKSRDLAAAVDRDLEYADLEIYTSFSNEREANDQSLIDVDITIAPNATEVPKDSLVVRGMLDRRLKAIGGTNKKYEPLRQRFTNADWARVFDRDERTARDNTSRAVSAGRLYKTLEGDFLYIPVPDSEVPELVAQRVHRAGRDAPAFEGPDFGEDEVVAFCRADTQLADLKGDWAKGAGDALALLLKRGQVARTDDGRFTFDRGFPSPIVGFHTVRERNAPPDGTTRESHHVPARCLAKAWGEEIARVAKAVESVDTYQADVTEDYVLDMKTRSALFMKEHNASSSKLTAILIHRDTHKGQPDSVHAAKDKSTSAEIVEAAEEDALLLRRKADGLVLGQLETKHWRTFIDTCYELAETGELEEGVDKEFALQEIAKIEAEYEENSELLDEALDRSLERTNVTISDSVNRAYKADKAKLAAALKAGKRDGDEAKHAGVLDELDKVHGKSAWMTTLQGERRSVD
jgi:hypothetical protein